MTITPASAGAHSAILNLDDPTTAGVDYQTMNWSSSPPSVFTAADNYALVKKTGLVGRNQATSFFVAVPAGAPALTIDFSGPASDARRRAGALPALPPLRRAVRELRPKQPGLL